MALLEIVEINLKSSKKKKKRWPNECNMFDQQLNSRAWEQNLPRVLNLNLYLIIKNWIIL